MPRSGSKGDPKKLKRQVEKMPKKPKPLTAKEKASAVKIETPIL
jgi:hypothetical protein